MDVNKETLVYHPNDINNTIQSLDDLKIFPSVTNDNVNILIQNYSGTIKTKIYALNGDLMGIQIGDKLSFKKFSSGIYFCMVIYGNKSKTLKVVRL